MGNNLRNIILVLLIFHIFPTRIEAANSDKHDRILISSGSKWEELAAYSRAVVVGDWVFLSGTVGFNPDDNSIPEDFDAQMDQIFSNISSSLAKADSGLDDIVRVRCFLTDKKFVLQMSQKLTQYLGSIRPTNTTIITDLAAEGAMIEIEITALKRK